MTIDAGGSLTLNAELKKNAVNLTVIESKSVAQLNCRRRFFVAKTGGGKLF